MSLYRGFNNDRIADQEAAFQRLAERAAKLQARGFDAGAARHVRIAVTAADPSTSDYPYYAGGADSRTVPPLSYYVIFQDGQPSEFAGAVSWTNRQTTPRFWAVNLTGQYIPQGAQVVCLQQNGFWSIIAALKVPAWGTASVAGSVGGVDSSYTLSILSNSSNVVLNDAQTAFVAPQDGQYLVSLGVSANPALSGGSWPGTPVGMPTPDWAYAAQGTVTAEVASVPLSGTVAMLYQPAVYLGGGDASADFLVAAAGNPISEDAADPVVMVTGCQLCGAFERWYSEGDLISPNFGGGAGMTLSGADWGTAMGCTLAGGFSIQQLY